MVWDALKTSKKMKHSLSAIWLDIANAYGSVPHRLIFFALRRYGIPEKWIDVIRKYYVGLWSKSFSGTDQSEWHLHLRGIFIGCTVSIILFLAAVNFLIEFVCRDYSCDDLTPMKAFMDDMFLMSDSIDQSKTLLDRCVTALTWAGMDFRASKSRSIVIFRGKLVEESPFTIKGERIPSIHERPIRFLGRQISSTLNDSEMLNSVVSALDAHLLLLDSCSLVGFQKAWVLQHLVLPRMRWLLQIYEFSISLVAKLEQKVSVYLRKWLNLHHSITSLALYSSISPCPLPLSSLVSVFKSAKVSGHLLLRDSSDPFVAEANPPLKAGRWNVSETVEQAESELNLAKITGKPNPGKAGLGLTLPSSLPRKGTKEYRKLISDIVLEFVEDADLAKAVQLSLQGSWVNWCDFIKTDVS